jgi:hypothetical protein
LAAVGALRGRRARVSPLRATSAAAAAAVGAGTGTLFGEGTVRSNTRTEAPVAY